MFRCIWNWKKTLRSPLKQLANSVWGSKKKTGLSWFSFHQRMINDTQLHAICFPHVHALGFLQWAVLVIGALVRLSTLLLSYIHLVISILSLSLSLWCTPYRVSGVNIFTVCLLLSGTHFRLRRHGLLTAISVHWNTWGRLQFGACNGRCRCQRWFSKPQRSTWWTESSYLLTVQDLPTTKPVSKRLRRNQSASAILSSIVHADHRM